jgi:hypothetical protein
VASDAELLEIADENYQNAWAALRMIREAIETLGPPSALSPGERVVALYGPEPVHEAEAIVVALQRILTPEATEQDIQAVARLPEGPELPGNRICAGEAQLDRGEPCGRKLLLRDVLYLHAIPACRRLLALVTFTASVAGAYMQNRNQRLGT